MKQPRFAVFCHAADALPNPQGLAASRRRKNRFRSAGITFLHPNTNPIIDFCMLQLHFLSEIFGSIVKKDYLCSKLLSSAILS